MGQDDPAIEPADALRPRRRPRRFALVLIAGFLALVVALAVAWLTRERIARSVISGQLESYDVPVTYAVESIGPRRQVLRNVVVGDPVRPDLTVERIETELVPRLGLPTISKVTLIKPRLFGRHVDGSLTFGSLDKILFAGERKEPFRLPEIDVAIADGRGLLESEFGAVGIKLEGHGALRDGFSGTLAAVAPRLEFAGCRAEHASLYGKLRIADQKPRFTGPMRLDSLTCPEQRLRLADSDLQIDATFDAQLDGVAGEVGIETQSLAFGENRVLGTDGSLGFTWRNEALTAHYEIVGNSVQTQLAAAVRLEAEGIARSSASRLEVEGDLSAEGLRQGPGFSATLAEGERASGGTFAAPLLAQLRTALAREGQGSRLSVNYILRRSEGTTTLVVPQAALLGGSGATLLSVSRFQLTTDGVAPRLAGNFATGGVGLPRIAGRLDRQAGGRLVTRLTMADYRAGDAHIALPRLTVVQLPSGALGFAGEARISGALPGGRAEDLVLPLEGNWSAAQGLTAWRDCTTLRFAKLAFADLAFDRRSLTLCPPRGGAIVVADSQGTRIAAGTPALDLTGHLGTTPIRIRSGAVGAAWPGTLTAREIDVALGPRETASRFRIAKLAASIGDDIDGTFSESDIRLAGVPLDILDAGGTWRYSEGRLTLEDAAFRLEDRELDDRFQPLVAHAGSLRLAGNAISADAVLREPASDREVLHAVIRHDLASGAGSAELDVPGIRFDERVQPDTLTRLALGVIANASGTVRGNGRIDWTPEDVTSTGRFSTDGLDFAAAFGPVKGATGTLVFTDLLGLVSAPDQKLRVASINPGIEVNDGVLTYELRPGSLLAVEGAVWPFLGGTLTLLPVDLRMGVAEVRRYTLLIAGIDAARFVERLELANIAATGTFDGALPLVFDENGGRIDGGQLRSRPPGGNVSYVGALTYKDLSTMANFAFDALKSLDYRQMTIGMSGPLEGEIVTRVEFLGIRQGEGAKRNFLTQRIGRLPIRFTVNVRARFFQLVSSFKSLYDPAYVRDPRTLGLLDANGRPMLVPPAVARPNDIQRSESGKMP